MSKFHVWMVDPFGYRFAFLMIGPYNVVQAMGARLAVTIGASLDWIEEIK